MPDFDTRVGLINSSSMNTPRNLSKTDVDLIALETVGYSSSDLVCMMRHAQMQAVRELRTVTHFKKVCQYAYQDTRYKIILLSCHVYNYTYVRHVSQDKFT